MYEYLGEFKPVHVMQLPNTQDEDGYQLWKKEVIKVKDVLETTFDVIITEEKIREAIKLRNEERRAMSELFELMQNDPVPLMGHDLFKLIYGMSFQFDKTLIPGELRAIKEKIQTEYDKEKSIPHKPRILITGCPLGGATEKGYRSH